MLVLKIKVHMVGFEMKKLFFNRLKFMPQMIEDEKVINVIGNAYVDEEVKHITPC